MEAQIHFLAEDEICASFGPVLIRICDGRHTQEADVERLRLLFEEILGEFQSAGMLMIYHHGTPIPDSSTRAKAAAMLDGFGARAVVSVALLGLGFWATALRAVVSRVVSRVHVATIRLSGSVDEAVTALADELIGLDPAALLEVYEQLWAELGQQARPRADTG